MKFTKRMSLMASALTVAFASGGVEAGSGISIDPNGLLPGGGIKNITVFQDAPGNLITQHVFEMPQDGTGGTSSNTEPFILGQTHFTTNVGGWIVTYQFKIPVTSALVPQGPPLFGFSPTMTNDTTRTSEFKVFLDMSPDATTANTNTGDGFGTLNGAVGSTNMIELAAGTAWLVPDATGKLSFTGNAATAALAENRDGSVGDVDSVTTIAMNGSGSVNFFTVTQNDDFVKNNLVGTMMDVDFNLLSLGPVAPFNPSPDAVDASHSVVGVDTTATGWYGNDTSGTKFNDFSCGDLGFGEDLGGGNLAEACSAQYQTSVSFKVFAETVPEPGSVALLGIGMTFLGFVPAIRRRRKAAAKA